jgi:hypothetical protein
MVLETLDGGQSPKTWVFQVQLKQLRQKRPKNHEDDIFLGYVAVFPERCHHTLAAMRTKNLNQRAN